MEAEVDQKEVDERRREKYNIRFHSGCAVTTIPFYLIGRAESESTPAFFKSIVEFGPFHVLLILIMACGIIFSLINFLSLKYLSDEPSILGPAFDLENYKLHYYMPYIIPGAIILLLEIILHIFW